MRALLAIALFAALAATGCLLPNGGTPVFVDAARGQLLVRQGTADRGEPRPEALQGRGARPRAVRAPPVGRLQVGPPARRARVSAAASKPSPRSSSSSFLIVLERDRALEVAAVHEERGGSVHAEPRRLCGVGVDPLLESRRRRRRDRIAVRSSPISRAYSRYFSGLIAGWLQKILSCIGQNLPWRCAASAAACAAGAFACIAERHVLEHDPHAVAVGPLDLVERGHRAAAVRALEIAELDHGDLRVRIAAHRRALRVHRVAPVRVDPLARCGVAGRPAARRRLERGLERAQLVTRAIDRAANEERSGHDRRTDDQRRDHHARRCCSVPCPRSSGGASSIAARDRAPYDRADRTPCRSAARSRFAPFSRRSASAGSRSRSPRAGSRRTWVDSEHVRNRMARRLQALSRTDRARGARTRDSGRDGAGACSARTGRARPPRCACCSASRARAGAASRSAGATRASPRRAAASATCPSGWCCPSARRVRGFLRAASGAGRPRRRRARGRGGRRARPRWASPTVRASASAGSRRGSASASASRTRCSARPSCSILDEPTSGLDPLGIRDARGWLQAARARGAALLVSSHGLSEVERTCERIAILNEGRLAASGALAELAQPGESLEDVFVRAVRG